MAEHAQRDTEERDPIWEKVANVIRVMSPGVAESGDAEHAKADDGAAHQEKLLFLMKKLFVSQ